jgi:hypothetical protein
MASRQYRRFLFIEIPIYILFENNMAASQNQDKLQEEPQNTVLAHQPEIGSNKKMTNPERTDPEGLPIVSK